MTAAAIRIDVVSDVVCPWCAIGLAGLEQALADTKDAVTADIRFHPFELNPDMPAEGEAVGDHVARKYGVSPDQAKAAGSRIATAAGEVGLDLSGRSDRLYNSFDAHRLLCWADALGQQMALKKALLAAYFTRAANIADPAVLVAAARDAGLDGDEAAAILASDRYARDVRAAEAHWREEGVMSVPTMILDGRFVVQGAQSPERLAKALRRLAEAKVSAEA